MGIHLRSGDDAFQDTLVWKTSWLCHIFAMATSVYRRHVEPSTLPIAATNISDGINDVSGSPDVCDSEYSAFTALATRDVHVMSEFSSASSKNNLESKTSVTVTM
jgi:hypothetical protein